MEGLLLRAEEARRREYINILTSLGAIKHLLEKPTVTNVYVCTKGCVSVSEFGQEIADTDIVLSHHTRLQMCNQIAHSTGIIINFRDYPVLESTIPIFDCRITAIYPPWTEDITIAIRKKGKIFPLKEYVKSGRLSEERCQLIKTYIADRKNIIISGSTDSGKTISKRAFFYR